MIKNDITYEYRVFTNRLVDVESMEVGRCTSKSIKELKAKDKINGRFFHTSDTDEWYFCWDGELQKLNLKGNSDVNAALAEVEKLIANANSAVDEAKKTASEAKEAAAEAKTAADAASAAVENIESKADKSDVEAVSKVVELKADKSVVDGLSDKVDAIKVPSLDGYATELFVGEEIAKIDIPTVPTNVSAFNNDAGYLTSHQDISGKQDIISDLADIRANSELAKTALQAIPSEYVTEDELNGKGYLTASDADLKYAPIGSEGVDLSDYATKEFVGEEIGKIVIPEIPSMEEFAKKSDLDDYVLKSEIPTIPSLDGYATKTWVGEQGFLTEHQDITGKQDVIADLDDIRSKANSAIQEIPAEYITDGELTAKGYLTEHQSLDNYYTKEEIDGMIKGINDLIGEATNITNIILA